MRPQPTKGFYAKLMVLSGGREIYELQRWHVTRSTDLGVDEDGEKNLGMCDFVKRTIYVLEPLTDEEYWSVLYHEVLHVSCYDLAEPAVLRSEHNWQHVFAKAGFFEEDD